MKGLGERLQLLGERSSAQDGIFRFGCKFKEMGEQAVKDTDLILEGGITVFGESRRVREQLGEAMTLGGAFEDAQRVSTALGRGINIHFDGEAGAALGELGGELDFRRF